MQILSFKKSTFYIIIILVLLAGIILGSLIVSYAFYKNRDKVCLATEQPVVNTNLTENQVQTAVSLDSNKIMSGKVVSKEASAFTMQVSITNPLDSKNSTTTMVQVPFDSTKDEVIIAKTDAKTSTVSTTNGSIDDIKTGQQVLLKILNGKKTIYLSS